MKKYFILLTVVYCIANAAIAQTAQPAATPPKNTNPITKSRILQVDSAIVTKHSVTIKGKVIPYTATAGSIPVWDEDGRPVAGVFYTYYERDDVSDRATRPLVISFNGGPGTPLSLDGNRLYRPEAAQYGQRRLPRSALWHC